MRWTALVMVGSLAVVACGSDDKTPASEGSGGEGGANASGGKSGDGGTTGNGGTAGDGGVDGKGGTSGDGGTASGGVSASGGASATGGVSATGGAPPGTGTHDSKATASGTVNGAPLRPAGAISDSSTQNGLAVTVIVVADIEALCASVEESRSEGHDFANVFALSLSVGQRGVATIAPGTYAVGDPDTTMGNVAAAGINHNDAQCDSDVSLKASSGSIEITDVDAGGVAGSYSLTFENGDTLAGSFDAPTCKRLLDERDPNTTEKCLPRPG